MENNNTEEPDIQIEDTTTDSVIFSVTYPNYQNNLLHDKENKTLGQWIIDSKNFSKVKYSYAYLKNSDKMIVKKYHIQNFEYSKSEKGYMDDWKVCFVFSKSEDVFFEYPYGSVVQGRHYGSSVKMDNSPKLSESEIERRLQKSKETPIVEYRVGKTGQPRKPREPRKRTPREIKLTTKDKLVKIYQEKFRDKKLRYLTDVNMLVTKVDEGQEPEQVLTNYFNSFEQNRS
jgi:hypothetical protein